MHPTVQIGSSRSAQGERLGICARIRSRWSHLNGLFIAGPACGLSSSRQWKIVEVLMMRKECYLIEKATGYFYCIAMLIEPDGLSMALASWINEGIENQLERIFSTMNLH